MSKMADVQVWREKEFLPWKAAMAKYVEERGQMLASLKRHAGELQTIVAMLIEGRTKQALLAWNALALQPKLKGISVAGDGETLRLVTAEGEPVVLKVDDMIADLETLLKA